MYIVYNLNMLITKTIHVNTIVIILVTMFNAHAHTHAHAQTWRARGARLNTSPFNIMNILLHL